MLVIVKMQLTRSSTTVETSALSSSVLWCPPPSQMLRNQIISNILTIAMIFEQVG